jgi:tetratricopeptide (TPR) repeat protein
MLTFFTTCKPFEGATGVAQRNAIQSWLALGPACEVILVGDDAGTAETADALGVRHIADVARNAHGTPLLDSVFAEAKAAARQDLLCYINADIMLMGDFLDAVKRLPPERLLMISRRWNVNVDGAVDFARPDWARQLREHTLTHGIQKSPSGGPDFFVFQRYQWHEVPPFALGRTCFDNWMIYAAVSRGYPVIDASACVMAVHQNHDCGHADGGWSGAWFGEEAARNRALAVDGSATYNFLDATHLMTADAIVPAMSPAHMARRLERRRAAWFDRRLFLANALHELGRHDEELDVAREAGRVAGTPEATRRYVRAMLRALLAMDRADEAEAFVARLISAEPSPTMAYHVGSICEALHAPDLARPLFKAILVNESPACAPLKAGAAFHLAQIAVETGDAQSARRYAASCLAANAGHRAARALVDKLDAGAECSDELIEAVKVLGDATEARAAARPRAGAED